MFGLCLFFFFSYDKKNFGGETRDFWSKWTEKKFVVSIYCKEDNINVKKELDCFNFIIFKT